MSKYKYDSINVRDFGAKGNGTADDTAAINAAFEAMRKAGIITNPELPRQWGGPEWFPGTCPAVVFPCGHYKISDAINIAGNFVNLTNRDMGAHTIRGDNAVIDQINPDKDIFVSTYSIMTHITGFKFVNGRNQVWLDAPNTSGFFKVTDCEFHEARGFAVIFGYHCNSTLAYLSGCCFLNCEQWIYTMTDVTTFRDVHGGTRAGMANKAAFDIRGGIVTMDNIMATPWADAPDQRFIDNRCSQLKLSNWRFGGEFGGFLPVRNFRKYVTNTSYQSAIIMDNCFLANQCNTKRPCVIYCDEVPNRIVVTNSTVVGIPVIMVDPRIDLKIYFKGMHPGMLKFTVANCTGQTSDMPEGLKTPVVVQTAEDDGLSDVEVARSLDAAAEVARKIPAWKGPAVVFGGHREQTDPTRYKDIPDDKRKWTVDGYADAEVTPNSKYFAVFPGDDGVILMRRHKQGGNGWVLLRDITIDLDRYPWLSYRLKPLECGYLSCTLRVIDKESGNSLLCNPPGFAGKAAPAYYAYDLRKSFGGGVRTFDIRVYPTGSVLCAKDDPELAKARARGCRQQDEVENAAESKVPTMCPVGENFLVPLDVAYPILEYVRAEAK